MRILWCAMEAEMNCKNCGAPIKYGALLCEFRCEYCGGELSIEDPEYSDVMRCTVNEAMSILDDMVPDYPVVEGLATSCSQGEVWNSSNQEQLRGW